MKSRHSPAQLELSKILSIHLSNPIFPGIENLEREEGAVQAVVEEKWHYQWPWQWMLLLVLVIDGVWLLSGPHFLLLQRVPHPQCDFHHLVANAPGKASASLALAASNNNNDDHSLRALSLLLTPSPPRLLVSPVIYILFLPYLHIYLFIRIRFDYNLF
jgi:hypothetical protein